MPDFLFLLADVPPLVPDAIPDVKDMSFGYKFIQMLFALALVLGILVLFSWVAKRFFAQRILQMNMGSSIKVLEQRNLSPKTAIHLVEVNGKGILIGESAEGLRFLGDVPLNTVKAPKTYEP